MQTKLYILDNEPDWLKLVMELIPNYTKKEFEGYSDTNEFIHAVKEPAILLIDVNLNNPVDGIDVFMRIKQTQKICFPIYMTNQKTFEMQDRVINTGWGSKILDKTTSFFEELAKAIIFADTTIVEKFSATLRLNEIDKSLKQKAQHILNIIEK